MAPRPPLGSAGEGPVNAAASDRGRAGEAVSAALPGLGVTRFAARGSTRLSYEAIGDATAPAVVSLHDLLADRVVWRPWAEALVPAGYRLLLLDARGHGASAALSTRPYPPTELAADVLTVLEAEEIERAHFAGHGWGAATALTVARLDPGRVASLLLLEPDLPGLLGGDADPEARRAAQVAAAALGVAASAAGKGLTDRALDALLDHRLGRGWRDRLARPRLAAIRRNAGSLGAILGGMSGQEMAPDAMRELAVPALVVARGAASAPAALGADRLAAALPGAVPAVLLDAGEGDEPGLADPALLAAVLAFLDRTAVG